MLPWGPPACSGLLFPGRQSNLGSCSSQLVFLLGAASPPNLEELERRTAWSEEEQDCLHHWAELQLPWGPHLPFLLPGLSHLLWLPPSCWSALRFVTLFCKFEGWDRYTHQAKSPLDEAAPGEVFGNQDVPGELCQFPHDLLKVRQSQQ